jgi:Ankyrin repeats (3 copies)
VRRLLAPVVEGGVGLNVDTATNRFGWNALHMASHHGRLEIVRYLVGTIRTNVQAVDEDGWTALHFASARGHVEIVRYLIRNGANVNATNVNGETALHLAGENGRLEIVQVLHVAHANVEVNDSSVASVDPTRSLGCDTVLGTTWQSQRRSSRSPSLDGTASGQPAWSLGCAVLGRIGWSQCRSSGSTWSPGIALGLWAGKPGHYAVLGATGWSRRYCGGLPCVKGLHPTVPFFTVDYGSTMYGISSHYFLFCHSKACSRKDQAK